MQPAVIMSRLSEGGDMRLHTLCHVQVWVLDALPGEVRTGGQETQDHPRALIAHLRQIPLPLPNRTALQNSLLEAGFSLTIARWASTNLQPLNGDHR